MEVMNGTPTGQIIATYKKSYFTINCRFSNGFYCATLHFRQTNKTYYSKDKAEMNNYIKEQIAKGFRRVDK